MLASVRSVEYACVQFVTPKQSLPEIYLGTASVKTGVVQDTIFHFGCFSLLFWCKVTLNLDFDLTQDVSKSRR